MTQSVVRVVFSKDSLNLLDALRIQAFGYSRELLGDVRDSGPWLRSNYDWDFADTRLVRRDKSC